jgi:chemotaxis protein MotB
MDGVMAGSERPKLNATALYMSLHVLCLVVGSLGCNRNPYWNAPYAVNPYPGAPAMPGSLMPNYAAAQNSEYERRLQQLDENNRQLTTQLAQSQQQMQVYRDRADLLQKQLLDTSTQLQQSRLAQQELQGQARGMQASMSMRGGATLRPNVSAAPGSGAPPGVTPLGTPVSTAGPLSAQLAHIQVPGATVQSEGSVIRIRVPADQLFAPGTGQLNPTAYQILDNVATAVLRSFPRQRVAIEAHTDSGNLYGGAFATQYQLATAQAQAVMDQLVRRNTLPTQQLTVVAHGPNFPRGDNQSPAGRAENRRIEFVIYPETF